MVAPRMAMFVLATVLLFSNTYGFSTDEGEKSIDFSYSGDTGPEKWSSLSTKYLLCKNGKLQSPINILKGKVVLNNRMKPLIKSSYDSSNVTLINDKFTVALHYPKYSGGIIVDGKMYNLKQMHWHAPSEHRINGRQYAAELHQVHVSEDGNVSVVALLFKYGNPNPLLAKIQNELNELANKAKRRDESPIFLRPFQSTKARKRPKKYYRYVGSFTSPPCTENVIWHVLTKVRSISREQVEALRAPLESKFTNNSRPSQPMNGRHVDLYEYNKKCEA
ncbi:hypothetical protein ABFX02_10G055800 [Erythranthe guttata]